MQGWEAAFPGHQRKMVSGLQWQLALYVLRVSSVVAQLCCCGRVWRVLCRHSTVLHKARASWCSPVDATGTIKFTLLHTGMGTRPPPTPVFSPCLWPLLWLCESFNRVFLLTNQGEEKDHWPISLPQELLGLLLLLGV